MRLVNRHGPVPSQNRIFKSEAFLFTPAGVTIIMLSPCGDPPLRRGRTMAPWRKGAPTIIPFDSHHRVERSHEVAQRDERRQFIRRVFGNRDRHQLWRLSSGQTNSTRQRKTMLVATPWRWQTAPRRHRASPSLARSRASAVTERRRFDRSSAASDVKRYLLGVQLAALLNCDRAPG